MPPKISNISSDVTVNEGSNVTLVCMANGRPEPVITWRHLTPTGKQCSSLQNATHYLRSERQAWILLFKMNKITTWKLIRVSPGPLYEVYDHGVCVCVCTYLYKILFPIECFLKATNIEALNALNDCILCLKCMSVWHLSLLGQYFLWIKFIYFVFYLVLLWTIVQ